MADPHDRGLASPPKPDQNSPEASPGKSETLDAHPPDGPNKPSQGSHEPTAPMPLTPGSDPGPNPSQDRTEDYHGPRPDRLLGNRFLLQRLLPHSGHLGEVWEARDLELQRTVAVKLIGGKIAEDLAAQERFLREADITSQLEHSGVAPVFGYGVTPDGRPWYAMRFIHGQTLSDAIAAHYRAHPPDQRLSAQGNLEFRSILRRFLTVCGTISYAHGRAVIHRDLKPGNIMFGAREGDTLVLDWGLGKPVGEPLMAEGIWSGSGAGSGLGSGSRTGLGSGSSLERPVVHVSGSGSSDATIPGSKVGTPRYMSPEQARGEPANYASDVYGLGATLYHIATSRSPYFESPYPEVFEHVRQGLFRRPRELCPRIDPELEAIILKAMAYEPLDRYPSAAALADDLERWLDDQPVAVYRASFPTRLRRWARRRPSLVTGGLVLLLALAGASVPLAVLYGQATESKARANTNAAEAKRQQILAEKNAEAARKELRESTDLMQNLLSHVYSRISLISRAEPTERLIAHELLERQERLLSESPSNPTIRLQTAEANAHAARVVCLHERTDVEGGHHLPDPVALYARAVELIAPLVDRQTELGVDLAARKAVWLSELALWRSQTEKIAPARLATERALADLDAFLRRPGPDPGLSVAQARHTIAARLARLAFAAHNPADPADPRLAEAERWLRELPPAPLAGVRLSERDEVARLDALGIRARILHHKQSPQAASELQKAISEADGWLNDPVNSGNREVRAARLRLALALLEIEPPSDPQALATALWDAGIKIHQQLVKDFPEVPAYRRLAAELLLIVGQNEPSIRRHAFGRTIFSDADIQNFLREYVIPPLETLVRHGEFKSLENQAALGRIYALDAQLVPDTDPSSLKKAENLLQLSVTADPDRRADQLALDKIAQALTQTTP